MLWCLLPATRQASFSRNSVWVMGLLQRSADTGHADTDSSQCRVSDLQLQHCAMLTGAHPTQRWVDALAQHRKTVRVMTHLNMG